MLFVDGENLTIRTQELAKKNKISLVEGDYYRRDIFIWFPKVTATEKFFGVMTTTYPPLQYEEPIHSPKTSPTETFINITNSPAKVQSQAIRSYYYTSVVGDSNKIKAIRTSLWNIGFHPEIFKKDRKNTKAKGVDIALSKDLLVNAFYNNYDVAVLIAGDGDYIPLVQEVKRLGKVVCTAFLSNIGLSEELKLSSDWFFDLEDAFIKGWQSKE
jgi:uncharacterized LabA/DUF88 family protein